MAFFRRRRGIGLDVGTGSVKVLAVERRGSELVVTGVGLAPVEPGADTRQVGQAIHAALAAAGADGEPVVAAVGGPRIVVRQVSLPPLPPAKILPALEIQHRELGLLPPGEAVLDAQVLRQAKDRASSEILSVSAPMALIEERTRMLEQAAVSLRLLDVEPLALLNGAIHITGLEAGELLVVLNLGRRSSVLCLFSEQGPVVARYLELGAEAFTDQIRQAFMLSPSEAYSKALSGGDAGRAQTACREIVERLADDVRLSLTFYRTEYDRESLPRYALGGWADLPQVGQWVADRLGLSAPFELLDPLKAMEVRGSRAGAAAEAPGPQFLQAFGLALRGL